jgi:hypothetical protein
LKRVDVEPPVQKYWSSSIETFGVPDAAFAKNDIVAV